VGILFRAAGGVFFLLGAWPGPASAAQAPDPFQPGLRWQRAASPADPWIPGPVAFGADGETTLVLAALGNRHAEVLASAGEGTQAPVWRLDSLQGTQGALGLIATDPQGRFACLSQTQVPGSNLRSTRLELFDPRAALLGQPATVWTHDCALPANGPARIALDRARTLCALAVCDTASARVDLEIVRLADGQRLSLHSWNAPNLQDLSFSADASTVALTLGGTLVAIDWSSGAQWQSSVSPQSQALALSADAGCLVLGGPSVRIYRRQSGSYRLQATRQQTAAEICTRLAISPDGQRLALGWWHSVQTGVRMELLDPASGTVFWSKHQPHPGGNLQNFIEAVALSEDGRRAAFALWGDGSGEPEFVLVDEQQGLLLAQDLAGSARGLALDAAGPRAVLAFKDVHANQFGTTGRVQLFDTGERGLVQRSRAQIGQVLSLAARRPGASIVFFVQGVPSAQPTVFPGAVGQLLLVRNALTIHARPADALGSADLSLSLPPDPLLIGGELFFQAAFRRNLQLEFDSGLERVLIL
jgi:hypothetical protein